MTFILFFLIQSQYMDTTTSLSAEELEAKLEQILLASPQVPLSGEAIEAPPLVPHTPQAPQAPQAPSLLPKRRRVPSLLPKRRRVPSLLPKRSRVPSLLPKCPRVPSLLLRVLPNLKERAGTVGGKKLIHYCTKQTCAYYIHTCKHTQTHTCIPQHIHKRIFIEYPFPRCHFFNFAFRTSCFRCTEGKPVDGPTTYTPKRQRSQASKPYINVSCHNAILLNYFVSLISLFLFIHHNFKAKNIYYITKIGYNNYLLLTLFIICYYLLLLLLLHIINIVCMHYLHFIIINIYKILILYNIITIII